MHKRAAHCTLFMVALMLFSCVAPASAGDGWYVGAGIGKAWLADDPFKGAVSGDVTQVFKNAFGGHVVAGHAFAGSPLRLEAEFFDVRADVADLRNTLTTFKGGSDRHQAVMANVYVEPVLRGRMMAYLAAGIGVDIEKWGLHLVTPAGVSTAGRFDTRSFFAYQLKAGLAQQLTNRVELIAGYRFFGTQKRTLNSPSAETGYPHSAQLVHCLETGVRVSW